MTKNQMRLGLFALIVFISWTSVAGRLAVMSIDLGGEYFKVAIVKPGVPMEIALNKESSRKTPTLVAFRDGERHFASEAQTTALRYPQKAVGYLMQIIGRQFDDPQVQLFRKRFPYYDMLKDEERGTVLFKIDDDTIYSVEELLAMILEQAKEYAQNFAEQEIKDAVITVPPFYNQAERRAVLNAAKLVGINVLQLMSDNAAVALNYGVFRRKNFNATMQYYMFYDMGSTSTTATIVGYNVVKTKEGTRSESNPQLTIKGVGFDRSLGGLEFTLRLRDHLAKSFDGQKKTTLKVEQNSRAMAKLFKEAERVKKVLSANVDHTAQVENLLDEKDFKSPVTRAELEELTQDLFDRVTKPIEEALKLSDITLPEITEVILMGGGTRMPKVQEILMKYLGRSELGKSINTDEAAAMGAVYQAAYLGKGFKVKKFGVREGNIYPINVEFERQKTEEEEPKLIKRTLFSRMNPYPQKKVMTFNKHTKDFSFMVTYSGLDFLTEEDRRSFGTPLISKYTLVGVEDALANNKDKEPKGIKAHFQMDGSGILTLDRVESIFEKNDTEAEEKSTWSKLGSAIGGLFGSGATDEENKVEDTPEQEGEDTPSGGPTDESSSPLEKETGQNDTSTGTEPKEEQADSNEESTESDKKEDEDEKTENKEGQKEESADKEEPPQDKQEDATQKKDAKSEQPKAEGTNKTEEEKKSQEAKEKGPKVLSIKELIKTEEEILDLKNLTNEKFVAAKQRLSELRKIDKEKMELEKAKNELESFIFDLQDKLSQDLHMKCTTEEEREKINAQLSEASDWLYDQTPETKKADFVSKLKFLKDATKALSKRVYEHEERPKALAALKSALNQTTVFLATVKNMTDVEDPIFTQVELETLEKLINETKQWRDNSVKAQSKLKAYEEPTLKAEDVGLKIAALDREMRYLINKAKNFRPKPKVKEDKAKKSENTSEETSTGDSTQQADVPPTDESGKEDAPDEATFDPTEETETPTATPDTPYATPDSPEQESAPPTKKEDAKPSGEKETPEDRTSSGKRKPKSKRKPKEDTTEEEILQLDKTFHEGGEL
ncbi:hypoxia up-regulated protein 1-like isoform X2 [Biomphalaria glabrata]|uniref:Hypoxia up-regulated protein 1 n=1 Tax=Biomphalaria glabrata TaxID=6526 RepID=A0A9W2YTN7_BIOGL|nr:hypoxia up-regulated protein 1-like isoform X2 [Biomphalaria glabrata]